MTITRRTALASLASSGILATATEANALLTAQPAREQKGTPHLPEGTRILFQGDSITDGGRGRSLDPNHIFGQDYAYLIAAHLGGHFPEKRWTFLNRGISGNKVTDIAARWQEDALALHPNVISLLVGINDAASVIEGWNPSVDVALYEQTYDHLIAQTRSALPDVKFVLGEPFLLAVGRIKEQWERYEREVKARQQVVQRIAEKYKAPFVPYQSVFTKATAKAPAEYWIWDGIHPTAAGHQLMADAWLKTVETGLFKSR